MVLNIVSLFLLLVAFATTNGQDPVECIPPFIEVGGRCLYIDPWVKGSFSTIREICQSHRGDILWLDEGYDCDFYRALLDHLHENKLNEHDYWLGITDEGHEGDWRYVRNNKVVRLGGPYWIINNPSDTEEENCAIMQKNSAFYWIDVKCDSEYSGICRATSQM